MKSIVLLAVVVAAAVYNILGSADSADGSSACENLCRNYTMNFTKALGACCKESTRQSLPCSFQNVTCRKQLIEWCPSENPKALDPARKESILKENCCADPKQKGTVPKRSIKVTVKWDDAGFLFLRQASNFTRKKWIFLLELLSQNILYEGCFTIKFDYPIFAGPQDKYKMVHSFSAPAPQLTVKRRSADIFTIIGSSFIQLWPLLLLCISWTFISGIIIWLLDHRKNRDQFPSSFWKGFREGTWWAVVTMTTVGYGDKTPKTLLARIYATVWMITGMVLLSVFTAQVSSDLTSQDLKLRNSFLGDTIGVPIGGKRYFKNVFKGAEVVEFKNQSQLVESLDKRDNRVIVLYDCIQNGRHNDYQVVHVMKSHIIGIKATIERTEPGCAWRHKGGHHFVRNFNEEVTRYYREIEQDEQAPTPTKHCSGPVDRSEYSKDMDPSLKGTTYIIVYSFAGALVLMCAAGSVWDFMRKTKTDLNDEDDIEASTGATAAQPKKENSKEKRSLRVRVSHEAEEGDELP